MATLYDVPADELIEAVAAELDGRIEAPDWADITKTGTHNELPPEQEDFWHVRGASLLRKVAINGPIGVDRLATEYGGADNGSTRYRVAPRHRKNGSRNIIRTLLQQLEAEDLIVTREGEGRVVSPEGRSLLDGVAGDVMEELDRPELERYA